ncbi:hypothetical protein L873DRAFT_1821014 [Choiromyces venosus 120613-1]|uniref:Uncharacterized protein n=1 Tax=Choiromyces venosus 120613-1 TaxID=1336337 RepID=A0A3N4IZK8_9PEZI|nr:hypothetical protein L873DRAFT_1821014 [Choiromyces venosus 120613-1]
MFVDLETPRNVPVNTLYPSQATMMCGFNCIENPDNAPYPPHIKEPQYPGPVDNLNPTSLLRSPIVGVMSTRFPQTIYINGWCVDLV